VYAIVFMQGFQYRVAQDAVLRVPVMAGEQGAEIAIEDVRLIADGDSVQIGTPTVGGASVRAEILGHVRGPKILIGKYRRRKDYRRRRGHRTDFTEIRIKEIVRS
jgi:large subunit ribosomal protein L21